jgi:23S rRNA (adenine2030-N6)-methyltransferase
LRFEGIDYGKIVFGLYQFSVPRRGKMNYRHAYHAGNHADVFKHIILARIISYLKSKDKPFAYLDTHAGIGTYDLLSAEAGKTFEWETGIGKMREVFDHAVEQLIAPYRDVITGLNDRARLRFYPGSPTLAARLSRPRDRLIFNELHPEDAKLAEQQFADDRQVRVTQSDALASIKTTLPFPQRRGLVLIDPPYEVTDETERTLRALAHGYKRMPGAIFALWFPIKGPSFSNAFIESVKQLKTPETLLAELRVREVIDGGPLAGSGMIIINPPWTLHDELQTLLPALAARLGIDGRGESRIEWLSPPS